jgi:hypothetical protein
MNPELVAVDEDQQPNSQSQHNGRNPELNIRQNGAPNFQEILRCLPGVT